MTAGTKRVVQRHVIVRNLKSLEALGAVSNICSDKTGTLAQGNVIVKMAWIPGRGTYSPFNRTVGELGLREAQPKDINFYGHGGDVDAINGEELVGKDATLREYLNVASLANLTSVNQVNGEWHGRVDPTEIAIQVFASRFNWNRLRLSTGENAQWHRIAEFLFDSDVKKMSVIFENKETNKQWLFTKGAVERVLISCPRYAVGDNIEEFGQDFRDDALRNMEAMAHLGLRVLALTGRTDVPHVKENEAELDGGKFEQDLVFRGSIGLCDPPRPESAPSVKRCHEAGVSVHMLTGDHPETAHAISLEVGILPKRMNETAADVAKTMVMAHTSSGLQHIGLANARDIIKMIRWNDKYDIRFMKLSSDMFPFASHAAYDYKLAPFASKALAEAGRLAAELGHRVTTHPGQFTQIASPRKEVIVAAVRDLEYHNEMLSLLKLPGQPDRDAVMIMHIGGAYGDKAATLD
ncbi:Sodium transport ATPase 2 [Tolypocladium capitatum]|uniref:Sodium transport ATPase 2 n=1 Tax=Tolypocladium capitatum TaxID=45235 RepID=A0A2K3QN70_9HYPO|nr:Sodium transport ATPase 2 [Tolypocladium capitatum]